MDRQPQNQQLTEKIARHLASISSHIYHFAYQMTKSPSILLWELRMARYVHLKQRTVALAIIAICLWSNFLMLFRPSLHGLAAICSSGFIAHAIYIMFMNFNIYQSWNDRINCCCQHLEGVLATLLQKLVYVWFQNAYLYNAEILQEKLNKEIVSYEQTITVLNQNSLKKHDFALPMELNPIITDFLYHSPIQELSIQEVIADALKNEWDLKENLVTKILSYTFDMDPKTRVSFQISYGSGLGGSLGGKVGIKKGTAESRGMRLNVNYGNGKMPVTQGMCLEYDVLTRELIDAATKNLEKTSVDCSKVTLSMS